MGVKNFITYHFTYFCILAVFLSIEKLISLTGDKFFCLLNPLTFEIYSKITNNSLCLFVTLLYFRIVIKRKKEISYIKQKYETDKSNGRTFQQKLKCLH